MKKKIQSLFERKFLKRFYLLIAIATLIPIFEIFSVTLILPLLKIFLDNNFNSDYPIINNFLEKISYILFSESNFSNLIIIAVLFYIFIYLIRCLVVFIIQSSIISFALRCETYLKKKFFLKYLKLKYLSKIKKPYSFYYSMFTTQIEFFSGNIRSLLNLFVETITVLFISIFLLIYDISTTLKILLIFGFIFLFFNFFLNKFIKKLSILRNKKIELIFKNFSIILKFFKEFELFNKEKFYTNKLERDLEEYENINFKRQSIALLPRQIFEFTTITVIFIFLIINLKNQDSFNLILINLGIYVFVMLKIIPSLSKIMNALQDLKFSSKTLEEIYGFQTFFENNLKNDTLVQSDILNKKFDFNSLIKISNVNLKFYGKSIIENSEISFVKNKFTAIIGSSGSGKTSLLDLIMGFISQNNAKFAVDEKEINFTNDNWRKMISYVPQEIPIFKGTIAQNISLIDENFNLDKINDAINFSNLNDFVSSKNNGVNFLVEDDGKNISGGQKQRIGIARALYFQPKIIFFDEFTSSLDSETEDKILNTLKSLKRYYTIVFVTHNKKISDYCDNIFEINKKKIIKIK